MEDKKDYRELENTICLFNTNGCDSTLKKYDNKSCTVINRVDTLSYDYEEVGTMWNILIAGTEKIQAFPNELYSLIYKDNNRKVDEQDGK